MMHRRPQVPTVDGVRGPGASDCRFLMDQDANPRRRKWRPVIIEGTVDLRMGGELRVDSGTS